MPRSLPEPEAEEKSRTYGSTAGSRVTSPFDISTQKHGDSQAIYRDGAVERSAVFRAGVVGSDSLDLGMEEEPPPPFTAGDFSDRLFEKLSVAVKQREELPQTAGNPQALAASPKRRDSSDSYQTRSESQNWVPAKTAATSEEELYNPYAGYTTDVENEEDMKQTSPILNRNSVSIDGGRHSMTGEIGWAM